MGLQETFHKCYLCYLCDVHWLWMDITYKQWDIIKTILPPDPVSVAGGRP